MNNGFQNERDFVELFNNNCASNDKFIREGE